MAWAALALAWLTASGCANYFLHGAEPVEGAPADSEATYTAPTCVLADGSETEGAEVTYHLREEEGGRILYEVKPDGSAARITNRWRANGGTHFFAWVGNGNGYQYFFPDDDRPPLRYVFTGGSYDLDQEEEGVTKPAGRPAASCPLERQ